MYAYLVSITHFHLYLVLLGYTYITHETTKYLCKWLTYLKSNQLMIAIGTYKDQRAKVTHI